MTFGPWRALPATSPPRKPGLLQARVPELVVYPRGKSAMVYYDGDDDLALAFARLCAIGSRRVLEKHFGYHERARNRILLGLDQ